MAYKELIKNFNRIRNYMREFYVYGFKKREEYTGKSPRSYDNERRRIESILGDYMQFHQTENGKNVFLSIDSRITEHNPLYQAWKICQYGGVRRNLPMQQFDVWFKFAITCYPNIVVLQCSRSIFEMFINKLLANVKYWALASSFFNNA